MMKRIFPLGLTFFADLVRNSECASIFAKIPLIFQTNLKRVTKNCL